MHTQDSKWMLNPHNVWELSVGICYVHKLDLLFRDPCVLPFYLLLSNLLRIIYSDRNFDLQPIEVLPGYSPADGKM